MLALGVAALWCGATLDAPAGSGRRYDAIVLGTGLQESLLSGVLASQGKRVLCLERRAQLGGETPCLDLKELLARALGDGSPLPKGVGDAADYAIDVAPKAALASSSELQLLVSSGLWRKMDWRRVHRSFIYRRKDDGSPDVHRVPSNSEDLLKTRMMLPMDKARALQMYQWLEKFDEEDESTYVAGKLNKRKLNLHKMSALAFLRYWELDKYALLLTRGMAGYLPSADGPKRFKRMAAIELVRAMKSYKDAFRTFPHMTSPYLYPSGGLASSLATAASAIVSEKGGETRLSADVDEIIFDGAGRACGVRCGGEEVKAETVVASAPYVPDRVEPAYQARVLAAARPTTATAPLPPPPTLFRTEPKVPRDCCRRWCGCTRYSRMRRACARTRAPARSSSPDRTPAARTTSTCSRLARCTAPRRRTNGSWSHRLGSRGTPTASARWRHRDPRDPIAEIGISRVDAARVTRGRRTWQVARRELTSIFPLLKPAKKVAAEVVPCYAPRDDAQADGLFVLGSDDESSLFGPVADAVGAVAARISGEPLD